VALEAAQDRRVRVERAIAFTGGRAVAGGEGGRLRAGIVAESVLDVVIGIEPADEGDGLRAGPEGPFSWIRWKGVAKRMLRGER